MFARDVWLAITGTLLCGTISLAQGPGPAPGSPSIYGNPNAIGYPGYPTPPYGPPLPVDRSNPGVRPPVGGPAYPFSSYPPGIAPGVAAPPMPPGYAPGMTAPPMPPALPPSMGPLGLTPSLPPGFMPPSGSNPPGGYVPALPPGYAPPAGVLAPYDGTGPKPGADQPYLVPRDAPPPVVAPAPLPPLPPVHQHIRPPMPVEEFDYEPAPHIEVGPPCEPYTLYEGRRYMSQVKVDNTHVWVQANFIHWWVRRDSTPALVTGGDPATPNTGAIGNTDTTILLGDGGIGPKEFSGVQVSAGMWFNDERLHGIEIGGFWVGKSGRQYPIASNAAGSPVLAQPIKTPTETALYVSLPGAFAGSILVNSIMDFHGAEMNFILNYYRLNGFAFDGFAGGRYLYLNDTLTLNRNTTVLAGGALPFNGVAQAPGSNFEFFDSFNVTNRFYGGQLGVRVNWTHCRWDVGVVGKLGLGATAHTVIIDGTTTFNPAGGGAGTKVSGGTLAQASNIGTYNNAYFSVVPELTATVGYQITNNLRILAGYNYLSWTQVERAGNQIDRTADLKQSPTSPSFVPGTVGTDPLFRNSRSEFSAHGLNIGFEVKY